MCLGHTSYNPHIVSLKPHQPHETIGWYNEFEIDWSLLGLGLGGPNVQKFACKCFRSSSRRLASLYSISNLPTTLVAGRNGVVCSLIVHTRLYKAPDSSERSDALTLRLYSKRIMKASQHEITGQGLKVSLSKGHSNLDRRLQGLMSFQGTITTGRNY